MYRYGCEKNNSIKYNSIIVIKSIHVWTSLGWWW